MTFSPEDISNEERQRIARTARRNVSSEATLILTAGFAFLMIFQFVFGRQTFLPVAEAVNIRPTVVWVALSFGGAGLWACLHVMRAKPRIRQAREQDAAILYSHQEKLAREQKARMRDLEQP